MPSMTYTSRAITAVMSCVLVLAGVVRATAGATNHRLGQVIPVSQTSPNADAGVSRRAAPPSRQDVERAAAGVRDIFAAEFTAATNVDAKSGLAKTLLAEAAKSADPEDVWALLSEAVRLAGDAGDVQLMGEGIDALADRFTFDPLPMRLESLTKAAARVPMPAAEAAARGALDLANAFAERDDYQSAAKAAVIATSLGRKSRSQAVVVQAQQTQLQLREQEKTAKEVAELIQKHRGDPSNPGVCLALGTHLCFKAGDWEKGLPLLVKGGETDLAAAAEADLQAGNDAPKCLAAAERWERWAEGQKVAMPKAAARDRARELYARSLESLEGLERTRVQKKIAALGAGGIALAKVKDGPKSIPGLFLWLDVADQTALVLAKGRAVKGVARWRDLSGNGNDVAQPTEDKQPEFRDGGVSFDGSAVLTGMTPFRSKSMTLLAVFDIDPAAKDANASIVGTEHNMSEGWVLDKHATFTAFRVFGGAKGRTELSLGDVTGSSPCIALATAKDSGGATAQLAGGAVAKSADAGFIVESPLPIQIGARSGTWNFPPFRGKMYRVVLYSRSLEPEEMKSLLEWSNRVRVR